jgi:hypothetical protein
MAKGFSILFENPKRLLQPIEQLLFRNEYHLLFLLFVVTLPFHFWRVRTLKPLTAGLLCLMGIFVFVTATADFTLLDTHFGMVRFSIALTPLTAYFIAREVGERISNSCSLPGPGITRH